MPDLEALGRLAGEEFFEIVLSAFIIRGKLRVTLTDGSYIDFWWSRRTPGNFAYHWERGHVDETIFRHDNIPHIRWRVVASYPKHFHAGAQQAVIESDISEEPEQGLRQFLQFAAEMIG